MPAFGAGFRRNNDVLKAIGHFRAGVTDVMGQGGAGGDAQAFYMLRPFDLTGVCGSGGVWVWGCLGGRLLGIWGLGVGVQSGLGLTLVM